MTFLLTGTRAPATLDLARRLARDGTRVIGVDSLRWPLGRSSRAFAAHYRVPSPRFEREAFVEAVLEIAEREGVSLIWPTCEEIFHLAAAHGKISARVPLFCEPLAVLDPLHDKLAFARLAGEMAPASWSPEEAPDDPTLVWKPRYSRFGVSTRIGSRPPDPAGWMAQEFVAGEEFSSWALCQDGEVRTLTFYQCRARAGRAGCAFEPIWDEPAAAFIVSFAAARRLTGSLAFDFIRDAIDQVRVIECNPRLTSGIHVLDPSVTLTGLLREAAPLPPPMIPAQLKLATWFSNRRVAGTSKDVIAATGDPGPRWGQFLGFTELAAIAVRHSLSLAAASTRDLEYNGPDGD